MRSELKDIRKLRRHHGLTQTELARLAGVSQSLIAKIESGKIDPTYSRVRSIFAVLESLGKEKELLAKDIMSKRVISCFPDSTVSRAVKKMHQHGISQLPIVKGNHVLGLVSENTILEVISDPDRDINTAKLAEVMQDAPPIISEQTGLSAITPLLRYFPIVIVRNKERIAGVITKADMLKAMSQ